MAAPCAEEGGKIGSDNSNDCDIFRNEFKKYKGRAAFDKSEVIDRYSFNANDKISVYKLHYPACPAVSGLKPVSEWKAYSFVDFPGFIFIQDPFERGFQSRWVKRCLHDYPKPPNITNLHAHEDMTHVDNIWENSQSLPGGAELAKKSLFMKLRWVTLGYQYDWSNKVYYRDKFRPFPQDLADLSMYIAATVGYPHYSPEAAIVNYYHLDSSLGPHTDHSEFDMDAPLISFSFGQDAIFLLGGRTKATKPMAIFLHSGDICVMNGESRLAYHAVPRICLSDSKTFYSEFGGSDRTDVSDAETEKNASDTLSSNQELYVKYMLKSRINVNVRQVLKKGQTFPSGGPNSENGIEL